MWIRLCSSLSMIYPLTIVPFGSTLSTTTGGYVWGTNFYIYFWCIFKLLIFLSSLSIFLSSTVFLAFLSRKSSLNFILWVFIFSSDLVLLSLSISGCLLELTLGIELWVNSWNEAEGFLFSMEVVNLCKYFELANLGFDKDRAASLICGLTETLWLSDVSEREKYDLVSRFLAKTDVDF